VILALALILFFAGVLAAPGFIGIAMVLWGVSFWVAAQQRGWSPVWEGVGALLGLVAIVCMFGLPLYELFLVPR